MAAVLDKCPEPFDHWMFLSQAMILAEIFRVTHPIAQVDLLDAAEQKLELLVVEDRK